MRKSATIGRATLVVAVALLIAACGRTPLLPPECVLEVEPPALDFGEVAPGHAVVKQVRVANSGGAACGLSNIGLTPSTDGWFGISAANSASLTLKPGDHALLGVAFQPASASTPLTRPGGLGFTIDPPYSRQVVVPLTARIESKCELTVSPASIEFGHVPLDGTATNSVRLTSTGAGPCEISGIAFSPTSDPQFHLAAPQSGVLTLGPGETQAVPITFHAEDAKQPHHRTAGLGFASTDKGKVELVVPLSADIDVGCDLTWTPDQLNFGNVILNTTVSAEVTLGNAGSDTCFVTGLALQSDSDVDFTLVGGQTPSFAVAPGQTVSIGLLFTAADSSPPHLKTGTMVLQTGNARSPQATIPLSAYVSTECIEASRWIYTLDMSSMLSRFDPSTLTFTDIGYLNCPMMSQPNSMAVDQEAVAWVNDTAGNLYKVNTSTAACEATSFVPDQHGLQVFGMGFVFDPSTGLDTLFVAGGASPSNAQSTLATISFPSLAVSPIGPVDAGFPELTGTGDGALWGFMPAGASKSGQAVLVRIDLTSGATMESHSYPSLLDGGGWAMKFWGGSFWIFLNGEVYEVPRATPDVIRTVTHGAGRYIIGAGVSTCAPLQ